MAQNKPSLLITGGSEGIGKDVVEFFLPHSASLSRRNNFDIRESSVRAKIAEMSLNFDIFFNHAYSRDSSQTLLLEEVYRLWKEKEKPGYIFSTGTYGTYSPQGVAADYVLLKKELDEKNKSLIQELKHLKLPFRMTLLRFGMLDTERGRAKPHWPGYGVTGSEVAEIISSLYHSPSHLLVPDVVIEARASSSGK
jgi:hypothetical protein